MSDDLRDLRDATKAKADAVARVKRGAARELSPGDLKALLRTVPSAPTGAAARVKARVAGLRPGKRRPWARVGAAALLGASLLGVLGAALFGEGAPLARLVDAPVALDVSGGQAIVLGGATVDADGHGTLAGTLAQPRLTWRDGRVRVDATSADMLLETREAEVRVRRRALALSRDVAGTTVEAGRDGAVVRCLVDGAKHDVPAGARFTCPPVSAEGMLGRARHERAAGASGDVVLATVEAGLSRPTGAPAARAELAVLRMQLAVEAGRNREALADARNWLATGPTLRRPEVERLAAALALTEEGCAGALPHLDALAPTSLDAALRLAACAPDRARTVLDAAAPLARSPEDQQALADTRSRLGVH